MLDARLPPGVGRSLRDLESRTGSRVLLIRSRRRGARVRDVACFAMDTADAWLGRTELRNLADALDLDPRDRALFRESEGPLAVICTHGRRDPCCAERGRPLEQATSTVFPEITWASTHVGGDRFAGNLVAFPHGLYFGRVEPHEGPGILEAYAEGRIGSLHRYRGRSSHAFHVQAADAAIRRELGLDGIDDLHLEQATREDDRAVVAFSTPAGRRELHLVRTDGDPMRLTCHSERAEPPVVWRPIDVRS